MFDQEQAHALASAAVIGLLSGPTDNKSSLKKQPAPQQQQGAAPDDQQHQQLAAGSPGGAADGVMRLSSSSSISSSINSGSSGSGTRWDYTVQHLDLAAAVQQLPPGRDEGAALASSIAEVLLL
jgi:hypothetical protein